MSLVNCFKNFRRNRQKKTKPVLSQSSIDINKPTSKVTHTSGKLPGITAAPKQPTLPAGEDSVSFARHSRVLQAEYKKTTHNPQTVADLMKRTFALRREDILAHSYNLDELYEKYPFLQECEQVIKLSIAMHIINLCI